VPGNRVIPPNESQIILEDDAYAREEVVDLATLGGELSACPPSVEG